MMKKFLNYCVIIYCVFGACKNTLTPDQRSVKKVLSEYTRALIKGDFVKAYNYLSLRSQNYISLAEFVQTWTENSVNFEIKSFSVKNISIIKNQDNSYAIAVVKRKQLYFSNNKKYEITLDYHLIKEKDSWKILRTYELDEKIKSCWQIGDTLKAKDLAKICIEINPLLSNSPEEYVKKVLKESQQTTVAFTSPAPQRETKKKTLKEEVDFAIKEKGFDGYKFYIKGTITNNSSYRIEDLKIKYIWRKPFSKEILSEREIWETLDPGYSKSVEIEYWPEKEISQAHVDIYISIEHSDYEVIEKDIVISIPSIKDEIKFEIIGTSYQKSLAETFAEYIYVGRIDFKITNISNRPIDRLVVKAVWYKRGTNEILDETKKYLISTLDTPLQPGFSISDYITSGKGLKYGYLDLVVDIYISRYYDRYELIRKGVSIQ